MKFFQFIINLLSMYLYKTLKKLALHLSYPKFTGYLATIDSLLGKSSPLAVA